MCLMKRQLINPWRFLHYCDDKKFVIKNWLHKLKIGFAQIFIDEFYEIKNLATKS